MLHFTKTLAKPERGKTKPYAGKTKLKESRNRINVELALLNII